MKDLDNEILRLKLKKTIIKDELKSNVSDFKSSLSPINLLKEALGISGGERGGNGHLNDSDSIFSSGKIFTYIKYIALTVTTIKGGSKLIRRIKSIFR